MSWIRTKKRNINVKLLLPVFIASVLYCSIISAEGVLRLNVAGSASGQIDIKLNEKIAPAHVERIKVLTQEKKYDGVVFHRVIPGFMAQTGDVKFGNMKNFEPALVGMGGSDYPMLKEEFSDDLFEKGTVGMARSRDPNSANSQFFIMFERAPHLDGKYTIIGNVIRGIDVLFEIKTGDVSKNGAVKDPDYILSAELLSDMN